MSRRPGSYTKGVAKREEILTAALQVIAEKGYRGASVREIADAAGISQAGILYYFSSKEELFAEILRKRDELDSAAYVDDKPGHWLGTMLQVMQHDTEVPGLSQLYAQLSAEATDPEHAARQFFADRFEKFQQVLADDIRVQQAAGAISPDLDPERFGRIALAIADGMQLQWLIDPGVDMVDHIRYALGLLAGRPTD
ncbi:helix-turn-helix domain-containing protein [Sinomonas sp. ASV322]|uniref:TetR/AcrR family transcriptional regulator n=1 Tax=Sinomonas sp. ASV322 TaxID=3041920 RepID=UPI0027DBCC27|nr:helix-turn-helix domain-containing protein [Sinomonas sp. ASV322]MDQ4501613.1 helix-turn-helix domain-containing protein [Sinomonas sp. ASV322]